ncbi:hypothetical protein [Roseiconus lacunae]|uniref:hypothetical protein n=1 Tax=Roseiconus lacunae TaxID=2605694 RepID=UPI001E3F247B|nr:hypothetical protein [Roseiconus lacunae]MCD0458616.1 hypothetical protein [Roseiconus lacunae]
MSDSTSDSSNFRETSPVAMLDQLVHEFDYLSSLEKADLAALPSFETKDPIFNTLPIHRVLSRHVVVAAFDGQEVTRGPMLGVLDDFAHQRDFESSWRYFTNSVFTLLRYASLAQFAAVAEAKGCKPWKWEPACPIEMLKATGCKLVRFGHQLAKHFAPDEFFRPGLSPVQLTFLETAVTMGATKKRQSITQISKQAGLGELEYRKVKPLIDGGLIKSLGSGKGVMVTEAGWYCYEQLTKSDPSQPLAFRYFLA